MKTSWLKYLFATLPFALIAMLGALYWTWSASQLTPGGTHRIGGLSGPVTIEEDAFGVPTIKAANSEDLLRAQGWITARDRLFQMDLIRRMTGGELAELFGDKIVPSDRQKRRYGFRHSATKAIEAFSPEARARLQAFSDGVNAFIAQGPRPLEMKAIGYVPADWKPEDCILVGFSMFNHFELESEIEILNKVYPPAVTRFFRPQFGFFDAPIIDDPTPPPLPVIPAASELDLRSLRSASLETIDPPERNGSNAWAISGKKTKSGKPILAGDPHLQLGLPNPMYRVKLVAPGFSVTGVTVPGIPGVLIGANEKLAWSFTNASGDFADLVEVQRAKGGDGYLIDGRPTPFIRRREVIKVAKGAPLEEDVLETVWGPIVHDNIGREYAVQSMIHDPKNLTRLEMLDLNRAETVEAGLAALQEWGGPLHNAILADKDGHIAWTLVGHVPKRVGFDGTVPTVRDARHYWDGYLPRTTYPLVKDPFDGFIVSANQRTMPLKTHALYANDWPSPYRAHRLREVMRSKSDWTTQSAYEEQLDVTGIIQQWYAKQLSSLYASVKPAPSDEWEKAIIPVVASFDGKASVDSPGFLFITEFRKRIFLAFLSPLLSRLQSDVVKKELLGDLSHDEWVAVLLKDQPMHLLPRVYPDYPTALRSIAVESAKAICQKPSELSSHTWGEKNRVAIRHPFSLVLPKFLGDLINLPADPLPGASHVPRVGNPSHAAAIRFVVDFGERDQAIFNQPGGQSGHVLSAHYRDQYPAWIAGKPERFQPGPTVVTTTLVN